MERKEFIKKSCKACLVLGAGWMLTELAACAHVPIYRSEVRDNKVAVPLSMFAAADVQIITARGLDYELAIRKEKDNTYSAMLLKCTHFDNALSASGNGYVCNLHGSTFDKQGAVTQGPAEHDLIRYKTTTTDTDIIITIN